MRLTGLARATSDPEYMYLAPEPDQSLVNLERREPAIEYSPIDDTKGAER
jgi:hypothetical protein